MLPLFPLGTVLMPGAQLSLHIFEPRYRQLTIDLVTGALPTKEFGVIAVREGWAPDRDGIRGLHRVGCTAELRDVQKHADGRFDIVTRGARRFRLQTLDARSRPYLMGTVEWLPDTDDDAGDVSAVDHLSGLVHAARAAHRRYCAAAWRSEEWREPASDIEPRTLPHLLAADCLLPIRDRQLLLEQTRPAHRLRMVHALLCRETTLLSRLHAVPAPLSSYAVEHSDN
ncbi:MAG: LON peptidase substrate-binding domain-containing protein [Actinomycetota bacterium]|nr:LON peptidase substrate-binding domain-containing protein [Actinomycetota bacterium]